MSRATDKFYSERNEMRKDNTPSSSLFVWFIPVFMALALFCRTEPARKAPVFSLQDSAFICVMGVCL